MNVGPVPPGAVAGRAPVALQAKPPTRQVNVLEAIAGHGVIAGVAGGVLTVQVAVPNAPTPLVGPPTEGQVTGHDPV